MESRTGLFVVARTDTEVEDNKSNHSINECKQDTDEAGEETSPEDEIIERSYTRLAESAQYTGAVQETKDKWHEWFQLQANWMKNVEEDPENYFDDSL